MEDILASIRRILNEDDTQPGASTPGEAEPFALTEAMLVGGDAVAPAAPPEPPAPPRADPPAAVLPPEPPPMTEAAPPPAPPPPISLARAAPSAPPPPAASDLMAPAAAAAAAASVGSLLRAVSADRHTAVHRGGPTIEDLVREEIRPLLKSWLDEHLPPMVERLVRAEIERVVGRALS